MHYQLTCSCGATHLVTVSQAGQTLTCACGKPLSIPTLRGLKELPVAPAETPVAPRAIDQAESSSPSILIGILFVIIFLAVPCAIFFTYQRLAMDTSKTQERDLEVAFATIDEATPVMLSDAWDKYSTRALGPPSKPDFYYVQKLRRTTEWKIAIASGIALAAAALAAAVAVTRNVARDKR